jgi:GNAT superfamily N-acetyltransferase
VSVPADDAGWVALNRAGMPPCWRALAEGSGGSVWERDGVLAAVVPKAPERSVFNSVFYERPEALLASLDELAALYKREGIAAWTVWVPEGDAGVGPVLESAGHSFDGEPRYMGMALAELREPGRPAGVNLREGDDYAELARINEIAYGYPPGDFAAVADPPRPEARLWFADEGGEAVSALGIWQHAGDAIVIWVATLPEARGRGIARALLGRALEAAREDGLETTTLQSTKLGAPVYERLGYRDFGAAHMWERRRA